MNELRVVKSRAESYEKQLVVLKKDNLGLQKHREQNLKQGDDYLNQMEEKDRKIEGLIVKHGECLKQMQEKDRHILGLDGEHEERLKQIQDKKRQILVLTRQYEEALKQMGEKDLQIQALNRKHKEAMEQIHEKDRRIVRLNRQHEEDFEEIHKKNTRRQKEVFKKIQEKDDQIEQLKTLLKQFIADKESQQRERELQSKPDVPPTMGGSPWSMRSAPSMRRQRSVGSLIYSPDVRRRHARSGGSANSAPDIPGIVLRVRSGGSANSAPHVPGMVRRMRSGGSANSAPDAQIFRSAPELRRVRSAGSSQPGIEYHTSNKRSSFDPPLYARRQRSNGSPDGGRHQRSRAPSQPATIIPPLLASSFDPSFHVRRKRLSGSNDDVHRQSSGGFQEYLRKKEEEEMAQERELMSPRRKKNRIM